MERKKALQVSLFLGILAVVFVFIYFQGKEEAIKSQPVFREDTSKEQIISPTLNPGERAITIAVDEISGIAGYLKPNDRVDILATFDTRNDRITQVLMQNVTVLGVGKKLGGQERSTSEMAEVEMMLGQVYSSVTLVVTPEQAQRLVFAQEYGSLRLILRHPEDQEIKEGLSSISTENFLKEKKIIPRKIEIIKGGILE